MNEITVPEIDSEFSSLPALDCPECGDPWLHQCGVDVFFRHDEDDNRGQHASVDYDGSVSVQEDVSSSAGNPNSRRDGVRIQFWCEMCSGSREGEIFDLVIAQHKGNEHVYWEDV